MKVQSQGHLAPFVMLGARPGKCDQCATEHAPEQPHNPQLFYQYHFYNANGRWPNWMDALEHCPLEIQLLWLFELEIAGVDVEAGHIHARKDSAQGAS